MRDHFYCVKEMFELYKSKEALQELAARPDLDTICAFDYNRMKQTALHGNGLQYVDSHPEAQGIKVPKLE